MLIGESTATPAAWGIARMSGGDDSSGDLSYGFDGTFNSDVSRLPQTLPAAVMPDGDVILAGKRLLKTGTFEVVRVDAGELPTLRLNSRGSLLVVGTSQDDQVELHIRPRDGRLAARIDDLALAFAPSKVKRIAIATAGGNDTVTIAAGVRGASVDAGAGLDTLFGGQNADTLFGNAGDDQIFGFDGDDILVGGAATDYLLGGAGNDRLLGDDGNDTLSGAGGNDRIFGGGGADHILGGAGSDSAAASDEDFFDSIETLL